MELFLALLAGLSDVVAPVFLVAAMGHLWVRGGQPFDNAFVTTFTVNVATPCLVFATFAHGGIGGGELRVMSIAALACLGLTAAIAMPILLLARQPLRVYLPALIFPNSGNLGIPVCLFAFGEEGQRLAVVTMTVLSVLQFAIGPALAGGRGGLGLVFRMPLLYAVLLALAMMGLDWPVPGWAANATTLLGACAVPLMLFSLGVALARLKLAGARKALVMSTLRLGLGFLVGLAVAAAMELEGTMRGVVVLESAMPVAVFNYLWAVHYDNAPEQVAGMVLLSTAIAMLVLPLMLMAVA